MLRTIALLLTIALAATRAPAQQPVQAFTGATIIDGTGRAPIVDGTLLVTGQQIVAVGPRSEVAIPQGATRHDVRGKWIIPGMIDVHVHFWESARPGAQPTFAADLRALFPYEDEVAWMKRRIPFTLSRYVCSGVTSVIVLGAIGWEYEVQALAQRQPEAPRVFIAAGVFNSSPLVGLFPIFDGEQTGYYAATPDEAVALLRRVAERPTDLVKVVVWPTPEHPYNRFKRVLRALISEAQSRRLPVSVHAWNLEEAKDVLEAGADNLAHPIIDLPVDSAFITSAVRRNATVTSTIGLFVGHARLAAERFELEAPELSCGDPEVVAAWKRWAAIPLAERPTLPPFYSQLPGIIDQSTANVRRLHAAGVAIAIGSDGGNIGTMHGPGFHRELRLLAKAGMSPMDAIVAATRNGARVAGQERELGSLETGKLADFVVLDADPLVDVANLDRVSSVFVRGRLIERASLQEQR